MKNQNPLKSNNINWKKYMLELLVVFLGVSAGFILNNNRELRNNKKLEQNYIQGFLQNVDSNIVSLEENIKEDSIWLSQTRNHLQNMQSSKYIIDSMSIIVQRIVYVSKLLLKTNTYEAIKFSGNLNLIRNFNIKEKIVSYHSSIEGVYYVDNYYNKYFSDFVLPFVINDFSMIENKLFNGAKDKTGQFYNITGAYYSIRSQRNNVLKQLLVESRTLRNELSRYLISEF